MADPLSMTASIAGLISLAQTLVPLLVGYVQNVQGYPKKFIALVNEVLSLCGVLCMLQPIIRRIEKRSDGGEINQGISMFSTV